MLGFGYTFTPNVVGADTFATSGGQLAIAVVKPGALPALLVPVPQSVVYAQLTKSDVFCAVLLKYLITNFCDVKLPESITYVTPNVACKPVPATTQLYPVAAAMFAPAAGNVGAEKRTLRPPHTLLTITVFVIVGAAGCANAAVKPGALPALLVPVPQAVVYAQLTKSDAFCNALLKYLITNTLEVKLPESITYVTP